VTKVILSARGLTKHYGDVKAVNGLDLEIFEGECFGLLGPNGAGKSTTIEMLEQVITPDSGDILFNNQPIDGSFSQLIGIQFQDTSLQDFLTVKDTLALFRALYIKPQSMDKLIEQCGLEDLLDRDNRKLSGGQRQRLLLALALINDPKLVFLDEPTTGLDPQARRNFWQLIEHQKELGKTILLTTHYMDEAQILCDRIAVVDKGVVIALGPPQLLLKQHLPGMMISLPQRAINQVDSFSFKVEAVGQEAIITTTEVDLVVRELLHHQVDITGLMIKAPTLEDLFLKLTGHNLRE